MGSERYKIRPVKRKDAAAVTALFCCVYEDDPERVQPLVEKELDWVSLGLIQRHVFVAEIQGNVVGYGRSGRLDREALKDARGMPSGWYLMGLVVDEGHRRKGIGHALTAHRLQALRKLSRIVYYFSNKDNLASIRLHEAFGFRVLTDDFFYITRDFGEGEGLLFQRT